MTTTPGPFQSEREARAWADTFRTDPPAPDENLALLTSACEDAGAELGAYDMRLLVWLACWNRETCAGVAAIIRRAAAREATS